ncbi:MAG TPA: hypothetical protein PLL30_00215 [Candidatus Krumholzibacteria bacterium]|nr:hypothetical protein [Candidatus Krumholzibacteria bacterium]HPD70182.1 hypothetical protein [Candidatus Krumholzibacteria bacterium]HRY40118.1 hypothetical protein [Candidatus Krumholzibacteria bacterium]
MRAQHSIRSVATPLLATLALTGHFAAAPAQDVTAPLVTQASASVAATTNGEPLTILVDAAADELATFVVTCEYASSYPLFAPEPDAHWLYKTAAVGAHSASSLAPALSVTDLELLVGPRCYHSDTLRVFVEAVDASGNRSLPQTVLNETIEMPLGPIPSPAGDGYGFTAAQVGGALPNSATIEEWAQADVIICSSQHLLSGDTSEGPQYRHWVRDLRAVPGSRNVAVVAFEGGVALWNNPEIPFAYRCYELIDRIYRDAQAAASPDTNVLAHLVDGSLAVVLHPNIEVGSRLLNLLHESARDTLAWYVVNEWNHFENRVANVGLMFDVWEYASEYPIYYQGEVRFSPELLDRDLDGVPMIEDFDDQAGSRSSRLDFVRGLRRRLYASAQDPAVGRHFLIGGNSVSARCDAEMAGLLDHIFVEDLQCPRGCGTGLGALPYHNGLDPDYVRTEFPSYSLIDGILIPSPPDFTSDFPNLAAAMRDSAGGPFVTPEGRGTCNDEMQDPVYNEVYALLVDHLYPVWSNRHAESDRSWRTPMADGYLDLHGLGRALQPFSRGLRFDGGLVWSRPFEHGDVEVVIADTTGFRCDRGDRFEYRVTVGGETARQSPHWGPPELEAFFVTAWDSAGFNNAVRVALIAVASEPVTWERSCRAAEDDDWSPPAVTADREVELGETWDTGLPPRTGSVWVRVRARDEAGQRSFWQAIEVPLVRSDESGIEVVETRVYGTAYGLPAPGGQYRVLGTGSEPPSFAPPHYLEITGTVAGGFVPVKVEWTNSLGGKGAGEAGVEWLIRDVELFRGVNVITITCTDAAGQKQTGTHVVDWDFPGRPGSRGR